MDVYFYVRFFKCHMSVFQKFFGQNFSSETNEVAEIKRGDYRNTYDAEVHRYRIHCTVFVW